MTEPELLDKEGIVPEQVGCLLRVGEWGDRVGLWVQNEEQVDQGKRFANRVSDD